VIYSSCSLVADAVVIEHVYSNAVLTSTSSYLHLHGVSHHGVLGSQKPWSHARSLTSLSKPAAPQRSVAKSNSTSALFNMATATRPSALSGSQLHSPSEGMNTLLDPRSPSISSDASSRRGSSSPHHPDLSSEVANLSNKLINAINHQTNLDDSLAATRHELESARERIRQLETKAREHAEMVATGILVKKTDVDDQTISLMAKLSEERKQRSVAEKDKKVIEQELEGLTEALFEEANKVIQLIGCELPLLTRLRW